MKLLPTHFTKIEPYLPVQRKKSTVDNYTFLCALLYIIENGCKWRALPKKFGKWHTIYVRFNRWSKNGYLERIFAALQTEGIIEIGVRIRYLDSTIVKVHPDATGALKKTASKALDVAMEDSPLKFIWLPRLPKQP